MVLPVVSHLSRRCDTESSAYVVCNVTDVTNTTIPGTAVLEQLNVSLPFYVNVIVLFTFALSFRVLAYLALRFLHRK